MTANAIWQIGAALTLAALLILTASGGSAWAAATVSNGQAEAKAAAKAANCSPTKVEVLKYVPGRMDQTVFKIGCSETKDAFIIINCRGRNCMVMY